MAYNEEVQPILESMIVQNMDEDQARAILLGQLDATVSGAKAEAKMADQEVLMRQQNQAKVSTALTNKTLEDTYLNEIIEPGYKEYARYKLNPGDKVSVVGNPRLYLDKTGENIIVTTKETVRPPNPADISKQLIENANTGPKTEFSVTQALAKLRSLRGDALLEATQGTMLTISTEIAGRKRIIEEQAKIQSGLNDAKHALDVVVADPLSVLTESGRTRIKIAQDRYNRSLTSYAALTKSLSETDPKLHELSTGYGIVEKMEAQRASRDMTRDARKEDKAAIEDEKLSQIPSFMHQNYRFLIGSTAEDEATVKEEKRQVLARLKGNAENKKLLEATPENIHLLLTDRNGSVRQGALKILVGYDKQRFSELRGTDASSTPTTTELKLKEIIADPFWLASAPLVSNEIKAELRKYRQMGATGSSKDVDEKREQLLGQALRQHVQGTYLNKASDASSWKTPETVTGTALGDIITQVSATRAKGDAPYDLVVEKFMTLPQKNADGSEMTLLEKRNILSSTVKQITAQYENQWLEPNMTALQSQWFERINNLANRMAFRQQQTMRNVITPAEAFSSRNEQGAAFLTDEYARRRAGVRTE